MMELRCRVLRVIYLSNIPLFWGYMDAVSWGKRMAENSLLLRYSTGTVQQKTSPMAGGRDQILRQKSKV